MLSGVPSSFEYDLTAMNVLGMLVYMGLVSGFSEEILFRGLIQTYLSRMFEAVYPFFGHELPLAGVIN
nr:CPBP family glutamic-type intramembrane protease [Halovivax sp. TS33]